MILCEVCNIGQGPWLQKNTKQTKNKTKQNKNRIHSSFFKQKEIIQWLK